MQQDLLVTTGPLPDLRTTPWSERAHAIAGAFKPKKTDWIRGASIVIVDDIITSGATIMEIASLLRIHGVKEVAAVALAHSEMPVT
jgi:predicted amidophosphoribosyltransferase